MTWETALDGIGDNDLLPTWGPLVEELKYARQQLGSDLVLEDLEEDEGLSSGEEDFDEDELDIGLIERMEAMYVSEVVNNEDEVE